MVDQTALYAVLGLTPGSDRAAVRDAYRTLARRLHPDVNRSADAADRMRDLNAAYEALRHGPTSLTPAVAPRTPASPSAPFGGATYRYATSGGNTAAVSSGPALAIPFNGITIGLVAGFVGLVTLLAVWALVVAKPFAGAAVTASQSRATAPQITAQSTTSALAAQASANAAANAAAARSNLNGTPSTSGASSTSSTSGTRSEVAGITSATQVPKVVQAVANPVESVSPPLTAPAPEAPIAAPSQPVAQIPAQPQPRSPSVQPSIPAVPATQPSSAQHITAVTGQPAPASADTAVGPAATRALSAYDKSWTAYATALRVTAAGSLASSAANAAGVSTNLTSGPARIAMSPSGLLSGEAQLTMARTLHFQQQVAWNAQSSAALTAGAAANLTAPRPDPTKTIRAEQRLRQAAELVSQSAASATPLNTTQLKSLLDEAEQLHRESIAEWARLLAAL